MIVSNCGARRTKPVCSNNTCEHPGNSRRNHVLLEKESKVRRRNDGATFLVGDLYTFLTKDKPNFHNSLLFKHILYLVRFLLNETSRVVRQYAT